MRTDSEPDPWATKDVPGFYEATRQGFALRRNVFGIKVEEG